MGLNSVIRVVQFLWLALPTPLISPQPISPSPDRKSGSFGEESRLPSSTQVIDQTTSDKRKGPRSSNISRLVTPPQKSQSIDFKSSNHTRESLSKSFVRDKLAIQGQVKEGETKMSDH